MTNSQFDFIQHWRDDIGVALELNDVLWLEALADTGAFRALFGDVTVDQVWEGYLRDMGKSAGQIELWSE